MNGEANCYGKTANDLQSGIKIEGNEISGTLNYVENYTGFSSTPAQQGGNYLALSITSDNAEKIETRVLNGDSETYVDLTEDEYCVYRIKDAAQQSVEIRVTKDGETASRIYGLSGLTLSKKG